MLDTRYAKAILKEGGVSIHQKDVANVTTHEVSVVEHQIAGGALPPDMYSHRDIVLVEMKDGTAYEVLRETVDENGNFSTVSARKITREVRKVK